MKFNSELSSNKPITELDGLSIVRAISKILQKIDTRLIDHGERVAFIACELCREGILPIDEERLFLLSIFHDIGAYKTDEIDRMVEFETTEVQNHAVYGYLFLKYMSPLSDCAETILWHHSPWSKLQDAQHSFKEYSALIHIADRMDIIFLHQHNHELINTLKNTPSRFFCPEYIELVLQCFKKRKIFERLADGSYKQENLNRFMHFHISAQTALEYLKMLAFSIDFRSENTVTHTVNTVSIALDIARYFKLDEHKQEKIYLGSLLHDIGKIAIPVETLEYPGRLDDVQMRIMRTHVKETESIIRGIVPDEICEIALRHHEKLDGSGYPYGLAEKDLTFSQRIVAVADIMCALISKRSYKEPFPKEKTISILQEMSLTQLDPTICDYVCSQYDSVIEHIDKSRSTILGKYQSMLNEYNLLCAKEFV